MTQPRDVAGRYASPGCPSTYRRIVATLHDTAPIPVLTVAAPAEFDGKVGVDVVAVSGGGSRTAVAAARCAHGHFRGCRRCG